MVCKINSSTDMQELGEKLAKKLPSGSVLELVGDVGAGKTMLVKGIGKGLGISQNIQSPSFAIFARYDGSEKSLHHYDFYRLPEPGLVAYDLEESLNDKNAIIVVEWADTVKDVLPTEHILINIKSIDENTREVDIQGMET